MPPSIGYNFAMFIDLHTHTAAHSYDSVQSPEELILEARGLGLDGICLTEHDAFWDPDELARLARRYGILLFPGSEINTEEGHFLVFGLNEYAFGMHKLPFLFEQVEAVGGAIVAAHPYRRRGVGNLAAASQASILKQTAKEKTFRYCHAMETINGRGSRVENAFSIKLAHAVSLPGVGGSDSHSPGDLGMCATQFKTRINDLDDLVSAIRYGQCTPFVPEKASQPNPSTSRRPLKRHWEFPPLPKVPLSH